VPRGSRVGGRSGVGGLAGREESAESLARQVHGALARVQVPLGGGELAVAGDLLQDVRRDAGVCL